MTYHIERIKLHTKRNEPLFVTIATTVTPRVIDIE